MPPDPLYSLSTMDVEIIEVYSGAASLPAEFWHSGVTCAVGVWTKRGG
jgi:hypothetical protein